MNAVLMPYNVMPLRSDAVLSHPACSGFHKWLHVLLLTVALVCVFCACCACCSYTPNTIDINTDEAEYCWLLQVLEDQVSPQSFCIFVLLTAACMHTGHLQTFVPRQVHTHTHTHIGLCMVCTPCSFRSSVSVTAVLVFL